MKTPPRDDGDADWAWHMEGDDEPRSLGAVYPAEVLLQPGGAGDEGWLWKLSMNERKGINVI